MADGSVLVSFGQTRVLCTASVDDDVPRWMRNSGKGWVTAEYSMLPGASPERINREAAKGKQSGRTVEIQRLIARSLRAACDMTLLGERQVTVDCDVLQADGGTRTASICGGFVALHDALQRIVDRGELSQNPLHSFCTAISVGIVDGNPLLDLPYVEDFAAEVDMNVVMLQANTDGRPTGDARFVEVQGTAEGMAFSRGELDALLGLAEGGLTTIAGMQAELLATPPTARPAGPMTALPQLVCASANPDKVAEISELLAGVVDLLPRPAEVPDVVEDADTLVGNARLKAVAIVDATGLPAVADDTGLEVTSLGRRARGPHGSLRGGGVLRTPTTVARCWPNSTVSADRRAAFKTVALVRWPDGRELAVEGVCEGTIANVGAWRRRVRVRRDLRPDGRRRPDVLGDGCGGEARHLASWSSIPPVARRAQFAAGLTVTTNAV